MGVFFEDYFEKFLENPSEKILNQIEMFKKILWDFPQIFYIAHSAVMQRIFYMKY